MTPRATASTAPVRPRVGYMLFVHDKFIMQDYLEVIMPKYNELNKAYKASGNWIFNKPTIWKQVK